MSQIQSNMLFFHKYILLFSIISNTSILFSHDAAQQLIMHVENCIQQADNLKSKITPAILGITGMSSPRVRHFLNNLCSLPNTKYLEVGVWQGSTFISALYKNEASISYALAIDNWSEFGGPKKAFERNISKFLSSNRINFIENNCFLVPLDAIQEKINIYFYDGKHSLEEQKKAFTYFNDIFEDAFIAVVDDYNCIEAQNGTQEAFKELGYRIAFERYLPSPHNCAKDSWWNGLYIAVVSKN